MYTLSLHRITMFKSGAAFSEHSPLLHQLSSFPNWTKPHMGLRKMFMGEVVGKRVVVQGLWVGGWVWGDDVPEAEERSEARTVRDQSAVVTKAPWA
jgi:serine/threonine-protein phosphatase 2A activator